MGYTAPPKGDEAGRFLAVSTPTRTFDTRPGGAAVIAGVGSVQVVGGVVVPGAAGLRPVAGVMNTTVTDASEETYLTVHAAGLHPPVASNLNVGPGVALANLVVSRMDGAGAVNLVNGAGSVHAIGDVAGYLSAP